MTHTFDLLRPQDWPRLTDFLFDLRDRKVKLTVTVKPYRKKRTIQQNRFYFDCVVTPLADHCGYTKGEMHDEILGKYVGWEMREINGHIRDFPRRRSTSPDTMETLDFSGLIQTGQQLAAELGVILPDQDHAEETKETHPEET